MNPGTTSYWFVACLKFYISEIIRRD